MYLSLLNIFIFYRNINNSNTRIETKDIISFRMTVFNQILNVLSSKRILD